MEQSAAEDILYQDTFLPTISNVVKHTELPSVCSQKTTAEANLTLIYSNTILLTMSKSNAYIITIHILK